MKIDPIVQKKVMVYKIKFDLVIGAMIVAPLITLASLLMRLEYPWSRALEMLFLIPAIILAMIASTLITYFEGDPYPTWIYKQLGLTDPEADERKAGEETEGDE